MHRTSALARLAFVTIIFASFTMTAFSNVADALVDTSAPNLELILSDGRPFVNGTLIDSSSMAIICLAIDDLSGIQSVKYSYDGGAFKNTDSLDDLHRTTISLYGLKEGAHTLVVRATNSANLTSEESVGFSLDLSVVAPSASNAGWVILTGAVAIFGFLLAVFLVLSDKRKRGDTPPTEEIVIDPNRPIL